MTDHPQRYEYRVVPAPRKGEKAKGVRTGEGRFALALTRVVNHMAERGWEFVRTDTLPAEERVGLTQTVVRHHSLLVFRRALAAPAVEARPAVVETRVVRVVERGPGARRVTSPLPEAAPEAVPAPMPRPAAVANATAARKPVREPGPEPDISPEDARVVSLLAARRALAAE